MRAACEAFRLSAAVPHDLYGNDWCWDILR